MGPREYHHRDQRRPGRLGGVGVIFTRGVSPVISVDRGKSRKRVHRVRNEILRDTTEKSSRLAKRLLPRESASKTTSRMRRIALLVVIS